jgi:hypothetical protein
LALEQKNIQNRKCGDSDLVEGQTNQDREEIGAIVPIQREFVLVLWVYFFFVFLKTTRWKMKFGERKQKEEEKEGRFL